MSGKITTHKSDGIGWITFDHPERRNAITGEMWDGIPLAVEALDSDPEIRVVVMRGAGDVAFVSGADISEFSESRVGAAAYDYDERNARAFSALAQLSKPLIALVHGFCVGGGCAIALNADLRYAADDSVFAIPAARLGLGYSASGLETLVRVVGLPAAKEIFFTARRFSAEEALRIGLVNAILPKADLDDFVEETARQIAENAPLTLVSAKMSMRLSGRAKSPEDLSEIDESIRRCYESADYQEGVSAFLEKRRPRFGGT